MRSWLILAALILAGCATSLPPAASPGPQARDPAVGPAIALEKVAEGFDQPILVTHDGREGVLYVVEQTGKIWRIEQGERVVWLDVSKDIRAGGEQGLLGLAFDTTSDRAYVSYTDVNGDSVLERVAPDLRREAFLHVDQPYANHNGGNIAFGPDGMLYFGLGDGGSAGDPHGNGQNKDALLGSLLRIDVSGATRYQTPTGNPYGTLVWAKGLRNPWRFSFDRETGDLYIGDVGQNRVEEIDLVPAGQGAGANFGWNVYEGTSRYGVNPLAKTFSEQTPPVAEYTHDEGCSVTGGFVYRGVDEPALVGVYFFADYCSGKIWGMKEQGEAWKVVELLDTDVSISSFGEDARGELYVVAHEGSIHKLVATGAPMPADLA